MYTYTNGCSFVSRHTMINKFATTISQCTGVTPPLALANGDEADVIVETFRLALACTTEVSALARLSLLPELAHPQPVLWSFETLEWNKNVSKKDWLEDNSSFSHSGTTAHSAPVRSPPAAAAFAAFIPVHNACSACSSA